MANNLSAILAGEAYVKYTVRNEEFRKGNKEAEQNYRETFEKMDKHQTEFWAKKNYRFRQRMNADRRDREAAEHAEYISQVKFNSKVMQQQQASDSQHEQLWAKKNYRLRAGLLRMQKQTDDLSYGEYIKQVKFNSKILELQQAKDKKSEDQAYADYLKQVKFNSRVLEIRQSVQKRKDDLSYGEYIKQVKFNSKILELQQSNEQKDLRARKRKEDLAYSEYIKQVKFNSKILELKQAKDKKSEDLAYAEYIKLVKFNSRVLELRQQSQKRLEKSQTDHARELLRQQDLQHQAQERSTDAFYDRQERKRRDRARNEIRERKREIAEQSKAEQQERERLSGMRDLALTGSYFGQRLSNLGDRGIQGVMSNVREYGQVESPLLSMRLMIKDKTQNLEADLLRLEQVANKIGVRTEYDAADIAAMQERLALGKLTPDQIDRSSMSVTNVASVYSNAVNGKVVPARAARTILETVNAQEMKLDSIPEVADKMAQAGRLADMALEGLGDSLRYAGGTAKEAGMDFDTILSLLVYLDKRGQKGEQGGTTLRGIIASILDPPKESQQAFKDNRIDLQQRGQLDFMRLIRQFEDRLGKVSQIEAATAITKMFPNRQMTGMEFFVGGSAEIEQYRKAIAAARGKGESLAANKRQGVEFSLDMVGSAAQTAKAAAGKTVSDEVNWGSRHLAEGLEYLGHTFDKYPLLGKSVGYVSVGLGALGRTIGAVSEGMGGIAGMLVIKGTMNMLGITASGMFRGLITGLRTLVSWGATTVASMAMVGVKAAAAASWPILVIAALGGIAYAIDKFFNGGALTRSILGGLNDLKAAVTGQWSKSDSWRNSSDEQVLTSEQASENLKKRSTYVRDEMGRVIGIRDPGGQVRARDFTRELRTAGAFASVEELAGKNDEDMRFFGDSPSRGKSDTKSLRQTWGPMAHSLMNRGGNYIDRIGRTAEMWMNRGNVFLAEAKSQLAINLDRSPTNAKNAKAWAEYVKQNPLVPGFEKEGEESRASGWSSFLMNHRSRTRDLSTEPTKAALENLGDYDARSSKGIGYILDLFNPQKENREDEKKVQEDIRAAAQKTAAVLEKNVLVPARLGKGK